jgi:hypothetical protein
MVGERATPNWWQRLAHRPDRFREGRDEHGLAGVIGHLDSHVVQVVERQVVPSLPQFVGHLAGFGLRVLKSRQV